MTKFTSYLKRTLSLLFLMVAMATTAWGGTATIDFENESTSYTDWTFTNMTSKQTGSINAHGGTYYGTTGGKSTASITTKEKIAFPGDIVFYVSKQSTNTTTSNWNVQVSDNGTDWNNIGAVQSATSMKKGEWVEVSRDLSEYKNVYVRIYYSGSTAIRNIDDVTLTYSNSTDPSKKDPEISFAETNYTVNLGESFTAPTLTNPYNLTATYSIVSTPDGALEVNETTGEITINAEGTAIVTATTEETDDFASSKASYTLKVIDPNAKGFELVTDVNDLKAGDLLIITNGTTDDVRAMKKWNSGDSYCGYSDVTINGNGTLPEPDANSDIAILTLGGEKGAWTLFDGTYYLYAAGTSKSGTNYLKGNLDVTNNAKATITIGAENNAVITFTNSSALSKIIQYNSNQPRFSCYTGGQKNIYLYRKAVATENETYTPATLTLKANSGDNYYATFSNEAATFFPETDADMTFMTEAQTAFADGDELLLTTLATANANIDGNETSGYFVPANTGVLIKAFFDKEDTTIPYYTVTGKTVDALEDNMLHPSSETMTGDYYFYKLAYDNILTKTGLGFYWGAENGGEFTSKPGLAYLAVLKTASAKSGFAFDNSTSGIESAATETSKNDVMYNLAGMRVNNNYKGIVIVNGKKMIRK